MHVKTTLSNQAR